VIQIFTDGGARGNPGPAAYGFVVKKDNRTIHEQNGYIGIATNNFAEYTALIEALTWLEKHSKDQRLEFFLDSQLVVSQVNGIYKVKNANIRDLIFKVRTLESNFSTIVYQHVPRIKNQEADRQVNIALDRHGT
jgi:ribonuclease HI